MLPVWQRIWFVVLTVVCVGVGARGFVGLWRTIAAGRADTDARLDGAVGRVLGAIGLTLSQSRTFWKRPWVSVFHSFIFYGFVFYLLVNAVDAVEGFLPARLTWAPYVLAADVLSALVLVGVAALVVRRFLLPSRRDFSFNERTLLHPALRAGKVTRDSLIVSGFILFHVGSRAVGAAARGPERWAPFASALAHVVPQTAGWREFGYWGALGSVLLFLGYFPFSKHVHLLMAPVKYGVARREATGVLPALSLDEAEGLGAARLGELGWPRLLDAYACVQCNRCQDVCPATATGKSLSPSALEINKRMELNTVGVGSASPLVGMVLSAEALWGCTTCGACIDVCPVGDEPMLDIVDMRREQVMVAGEFPRELQAAFRGMERAGNPWGMAREKRLDWAAGLGVKTTEEKPEPEVLFWVGCAASYDPQAQKTARAFVQLLQHAEVDFAVLGKRECCTGDPARRAGNEYLYRQLADGNVATLNEVRPKLVVATCPHCLNAVGKEYRQLGGEYRVMHHTEYLAGLVAEGRIAAAPAQEGGVAFHDPCYLGRHNGIYDAPRNVLRVLSNEVRELPRAREDSFCCGAGGAQFWKEEEPGEERVAENRMREAAGALDGAGVLAVGCPFCKSMLGSTGGVPVRDVAELLWEGVERRGGVVTAVVVEPVAVAPVPVAPVPVLVERPLEEVVEAVPTVVAEVVAAPSRKAWVPKKAAAAASEEVPVVEVAPVADEAPKRKVWTPKAKG